MDKFQRRVNQIGQEKPNTDQPGSRIFMRLFIRYPSVYTQEALEL